VRTVISLSLLFFSFFSVGQTFNDSIAGFGILLDDPAQFPGGHSELRKFISEHLVYTPQMDCVQGKCYLGFQIDSLGSISHIEVRRGVTDCPDCDVAAIRVVEMMPQWIPSRRAGKPISSYYNLPIVFN